jgi:hypothetical protein
MKGLHPPVKLLESIDIDGDSITFDCLGNLKKISQTPIPKLRYVGNHFFQQKLISYRACS